MLKFFVDKQIETEKQTGKNYMSPNLLDKGHKKKKNLCKIIWEEEKMLVTSIPATIFSTLQRQIPPC